MPKTYKVHSAAMAFPPMPKPEFDELKEDIKQHGIKIPILVNKKKDTILDGRNRIMAAHDLKLKDSQVPLEIFTGSDEQAVNEIVSRNIHRRHLTDDQRVGLLAKLLGKSLEEEAETRQRTGKAGNLGLKSTQGRTHEIIAAEARVGDHKARAALAAAKHAPKDLDRVIAGKEKLAAAAKKAKAKARKTAKPKTQKSLRERVEAKFLRFMESFAVTDYTEVRAILRELLERARRSE
jgi:ParB-like chromosome segregation protein Spo0J